MKKTDLCDYQLRVLHLHLTRNCNLSCKNCWISSAPNIETNYISPSAFQDLIEECGLLGLREIKLSGGEPFIYPFFEQISHYTLESGYKLRIETNGTVCSPRAISNLSKYADNIEFVISLDGSNSLVNSQSRNCECNYNKTIDTCKLIKEIGCKLAITTLITKDNYYDVDDIIALAVSLSADSHRLILNLNPAGNAASHLEGAISFDETMSLIDKISRYEHHDESRGKTGSLYTTLPPAFQKTQEKFFNMCYWGLNLCTVLSNLNVSLCGAGYNNADLIAGNLRESNISSIWTESELFQKIRKHPNGGLKGICGNCKLVQKCRGLCRAQSVSVYGDLFAPYPFCQLAYKNHNFPSHLLIDPSASSEYYR